jgi:two-component system phosphate regulon sensor histidine kinase PhoR
MKYTIFYRLFLRYLLLITALSSLIIIFSYIIIRSHYISWETTSLKNDTYMLKEVIVPLLEKNRLKEMDAFVKEMRKQINTRITVIAPDGKVLADSETDPALMENHKNRDEIKQAFKNGEGESLRFSYTLKDKMLYVAVALKKNDKVMAILRVSVFLWQVNNLLEQLQKSIVGISLLIVILSLVLSYFFARNFAVPINNLATGAREIASGNFGVKVPAEGKGEFKELADSFNNMSTEIKILFDELSFRTEELDGVIYSMKEGLLLADDKEKILMCNESFKKMAQDESPEGKRSWEVLKSMKFNDLYARCIKDKTSITEQIDINSRIYLVSVTYLQNKQEVMAVFHDITEISRVEKIKKDFVSNVSHELKTPLTAIKGFVETMESGVDEENKHYLDIIKKNTERVINIVNDLLLLSELEEKGIIEEKVDLMQSINTALKLFEQKAKDKGIEITMKNEENIPMIRGDSFKLEQAFINLIDNAVKYTEKGRITINLKTRDNNVVVEIQDTGIGIPEEHLPRIFERFYVVDASRSRKMGGTGLGLAIVKHIVLLHKGEIMIDSRYGAGTKFTLTLPL